MSRSHQHRPRKCILSITMFTHRREAGFSESRRKNPVSLGLRGAFLAALATKAARGWAQYDAVGTGYGSVVFEHYRWFRQGVAH